MDGVGGLRGGWERGSRGWLEGWVDRVLEGVLMG